MQCPFSRMCSVSPPIFRPTLMLGPADQLLLLHLASPIQSTRGFCTSVRSNSWSGTSPPAVQSLRGGEHAAVCGGSRKERASISATAAIWPFPGLEPSRLGKLRVVCRMLNPLWAGVSPRRSRDRERGADHGSRADQLVTAPWLIRSASTGWEEGYTASEKSPLPAVPSPQGVGRLHHIGVVATLRSPR